MSTIASDNSIIDIGENDQTIVQLEKIIISGVDAVETNADQIKLNSESSINTQTKGNTILTGESLSGTTEKPASILLTSSDTSKSQVVAVTTAAVRNTVITTTAPAAPGEEVAKADIKVLSANVEDVSIETSSTTEKSVVELDNDSLTNAVIQSKEKGADVTIKSTKVDGLTVSTSGSEASSITVDNKTADVSNAQIELSNAGGTVDIKNSGSLSNSVIAVNSNTGVDNNLNIESAEVANTQLQLTSGNSTVDVKSQKVEQLTVSVDDSTGAKQDLSINADFVTGFTLAVGSSSATDTTLIASSTVSKTTISSNSDKKSTVTSKSKLQETNVENTGSGITQLNSEKRATDTNLSNSGDGKLRSNFASKAVDTKLSNEGTGKTRANFLGKTESTKIKQDGKGTTKATFNKVAKDVDIVTGKSKKKGDITVDFDAKVDDIRVKASGSKHSIELEFEKKVTNANLDFGKQADSISFGGTAQDVAVDLGDDKSSDTIEITNLNKISAPFSISNFGGNDVMAIGGVTYTASELQDNPSIYAPIEIQFG